MINKPELQTCGNFHSCEFTIHYMDNGECWLHNWNMCLVSAILRLFIQRVTIIPVFNF